MIYHRFLRVKIRFRRIRELLSGRRVSWRNHKRRLIEY
jgi:hypothetical protein